MPRHAATRSEQDGAAVGQVPVMSSTWLSRSRISAGRTCGTSRSRRAYDGGIRTSRTRCASCSGGSCRTRDGRRRTRCPGSSSCASTTSRTRRAKNSFKKPDASIPTPSLRTGCVGFVKCRCCRKVESHQLPIMACRRECSRTRTVLGLQRCKMTRIHRHDLVS